jgi:hypothetical protein
MATFRTLETFADLLAATREFEKDHDDARRTEWRQCVIKCLNLDAERTSRIRTEKLLKKREGYIETYFGIVVSLDEFYREMVDPLH